MDLPPLTYASAESAYGSLEQRRRTGEIDEQGYREQLNALRIKDEQGHTWMLQERTGHWYVYRDGAWARATPPGRASDEPPAPPPPPDAAPAGLEARGAPAGTPPEAVTSAAREPLPVGPPMAPQGAPPPVAAGPIGVPPAPARTPPPPAATPARPTSVPPVGAPPAGPAPAYAAPTPPSAYPPPPPAAATFPPGPPAYAPAPAPGYVPPVQPIVPEVDPRSRRTQRREARRSRSSGNRPGCVKITLAVIKWDILWGAVGWLAYSAIGQRYPWILAVVGLVAIAFMALYLRRLGSRISEVV